PLDAWFVGDRRARVRRAGRRLGRVPAPGGMDGIHPLGPCIIWLPLIVGNRAGGGKTLVMVGVAQNLLSPAGYSGGAQLCSAAHEIMDLRLKRPSIAIVPCIG